MRQGVKQLLRRSGLSIVGEGDDFGEAAEACAGAEQPTLVLVIMSYAEAFAASLGHLRTAAVRYPGVKLILLADGLGDAQLLDVVGGGVHAVLSPNFPSHMLASSLQLVLLNQNLFPIPFSGIAKAAPALPVIAERPASLVSVRIAAANQPDQPRPQRDEHVPDRRSSPAGLNLVWNNANIEPAPRPVAPNPSDREWEILHCLSEGGSNKSIARKLGIMETTVKVHVKSVLRKLGVANRTQAAIWALNYNRRLREPDCAEAALASPGD